MSNLYKLDIRISIVCTKNSRYLIKFLKNKNGSNIINNFNCYQNNVLNRNLSYNNQNKRIFNYNNDNNLINDEYRHRYLNNSRRNMSHA